jgi:hypothetical protein
MSYIGSQPATNFETVRKQVSTTNSGTTITLDYSVSSVQDILVTVNAVVQSYDNYSVSGTTLTLGGTLNNDRVEILYVGRTFQTVSPAVGTVTNDMLSGSIANSKLANSSITLNGSAVSLGGSATVGGDNTPIFYAHNQSSQTISNNTFTVIQFDTDSAGNDFDPDGKFDTSNYRFTPTVAGYYFLYLQVGIYDNADFENLRCSIRKNASAIARGRVEHSDNGTINISTLVYSDTDDYFDAEIYHDKGSNTSLTTGFENTYFTGFKVIT